MTAAQDPGSLVVQPTIVAQGTPVEITYTGGRKLQVSVDFGPWQDIPIDSATGKGTFTAPPGSSVLAFSDWQGNSAIVEVFSPSSPPCTPDDSPASRSSSWEL